MNNINEIKPLLEFLSVFLGTEIEIVLSDAIEKKVVFFLNPANKSLKLGQALNPIEDKFISEKTYNDTNSVNNYRSFSTDNNRLRSSTFFIKNDSEVLIGLLTINLSVEKYIDLRDVIEKLINGENEKHEEKLDKIFYESYEPSFEEMMSNTISEEISKLSVPPERLTLDEKMEIIRSLDKRGTFLIKGSVSELAKAFKTTDTTIYRYITKLEATRS